MSQLALQIPKRFHSVLIGHGGSTIQQLQSNFHVQLHVPARDSPSSTVLIIGDPSTLPACHAEVDRLLGFHAGTDPLLVASLTLSSHLYGRVIGPGGATLRSVEQETGAAISLPLRDSGSEVVTVEGNRRAVDAALSRLRDLTGQALNPSYASAQPSDPPQSSADGGFGGLLSGLTSLVKDSLHIGGGPSSFPSSQPPTSSRAPPPPSTPHSHQASLSLPKLNLGDGVSEVLFFPSTSSPSSFDRFLQFLRSATRTVDVAIYTLSDDRITRALETLREEGIRVRVLSEKTTMNDEGSDVHRLANLGMEVKVDASTFLFHHKFAVLDGRCLINGSFNWTRSASEGNQENVIVTTEAQLVRQFAQHYEDMWPRGVVVSRRV